MLSIRSRIAQFRELLEPRCQSQRNTPTTASRRSGDLRFDQGPPANEERRLPKSLQFRESGRWPNRNEAGRRIGREVHRVLKEIMIAGDHRGSAIIAEPEHPFRIGLSLAIILQNGPDLDLAIRLESANRLDDAG